MLSLWGWFTWTDCLLGRPGQETAMLGICFDMLPNPASHQCGISQEFWELKIDHDSHKCFATAMKQMVVYTLALIQYVFSICDWYPVIRPGSAKVLFSVMPNNWPIWHWYYKTVLYAQYFIYDIFISFIQKIMHWIAGGKKEILHIIKPLKGYGIPHFSWLIPSNWLTCVCVSVYFSELTRHFSLHLF